MQERRTSIRFAYPSRVQYCPSDDLLPRDGHLLNLCERGAALLAQELHPPGQHITVSVPRPGEAEPLTITGLVRWSAPRGVGKRPTLGLEWLPIEGSARRHLQALLQSCMRRRSVRRPVHPAVWTLAACGAVGAWWGYTSHASLVAVNRRLGITLHERNAQVYRLEQREALLEQEVSLARAQLQATTQELAQLDEQARALGSLLERLDDDRGRMRTSYEQVRQERQQLQRRVSALEERRDELIKKLALLPQLLRVVQEAIEARQASGPSPGSGGNAGFVVLDGRPTLP